MAGRLSFAINFEGIDANLAKLKELNKVLDQIQRRQALGQSISAGVGRGGPGIAGALSGNVATAALLQNSILFSHESVHAMNAGGFIKQPPGVGATQRSPIHTQSQLFQLLMFHLPNMFAQLGPTLKNVVGQFKNLELRILRASVVFGSLVAGVLNNTRNSQQAARFGMGAKETFMLTQALQAIGIGEGPTAMMVAQAQFNPRSTRERADGTNGILGAARASQFGGLQQLMNSMQVFRLVIDENRKAFEQFGGATSRNLAISAAWSGFMIQFKTMLSQLTSALAPLIVIFIQFGSTILKLINKILEWINKIEDFFGLKGLSTGTQKFPGGQGMSEGHKSTWENIGFVFGGKQMGAERKLEKIADNTLKTAIEIIKLKDYIIKGRSEGWIALPGLP